MILAPLATDTAIKANVLDALESLGRWPTLYLALVERLREEQREGQEARKAAKQLQEGYDRLASVEASIRKELAEERQK